MKDVQLDKNSYARRLRDECNREGVVRCYAPAHRILNADDEQVIGFANEHGRLLLTYDRSIAYDVLTGALSISGIPSSNCNRGWSMFTISSGQSSR